jgi:hypothetical protein
MRRFSNSNSLIDYAESKKITGCLRLKREAFYWYKEGKLHRIDGPAIEYKNGTKFWYLKGLRHREDGPAVEYSDGRKEWFQNGIRHRIDGPAIEYPNARIAWYIEGEEFYATKLFSLIKNSIFLEKKQNGKYNLDWLLFLTDKGFEEFPIISEMESNVCFKIALSQIRIK